MWYHCVKKGGERVETKSLCAKISVELHNKITEEKEEQGLMLNEYMTKILQEYFELKEGGAKMANENTRTMAIQISSELMDRLKAHLQKTGVSQKAFLTQLITTTLDQVDDNLQNQENNDHATENNDQSEETQQEESEEEGVWMQTLVG